jgi:hypothetical protein
VRGGLNNGSDQLEIRVFDGYEWTDWKGFELATFGPNRLPVISAPFIKYLPSGQQILLSSLFTASDADGDAITQYQFWDGSAAGGTISVNGVTQPTQQIITVAPDQLELVRYTALGNGLDNVQFRVHDGTGYTDWKVVQMHNFVGFAERRGTPQSETIQHFGGRTVVFGIGGDDTFEDPFGEAIFMGGQGNDTYKQVSTGQDMIVYENGNSGNDTLHMRTGGTVGAFLIEGRHLVLFDTVFEGGTVLIDWRQAANRIENFVFEPVFGQPTQFVSHDELVGRVAAAGSASWEDFEESSIQWNGAIAYYAAREAELAVNQAPTLQAVAGGPYGRNTEIAYTSVPFPSLRGRFTASDADNDPIAAYEFTDLEEGRGRLMLNGVEQPFGVPLVVTAGATQTPTYITDPAVGTSTVRVRVFDGQGWSAPLDIAFPTMNRAPSITLSAGAKHRGFVLPASHFFVVSDDDAVQAQYEFTDRAGGGTLYLDGVAQAAGMSFSVTHDNLALVTYEISNNFESEGFNVRANDGELWSMVSALTFVPTSNLLPNLSAPASSGVGMPSTAAGTVEKVPLFGGGIFSASDPNGEPLLYEFTDNGIGGGYLLVNGVAQPAQTPVILAPAQTLSAFYVGAGNVGDSETLTIRVADLAGWGSARSVTVTMTNQLNTAPQVEVFNRFANVGGYVDLVDNFVIPGGLFKLTDSDGLGRLFDYEVRVPASVQFHGTYSSLTPGTPNVYGTSLGADDQELRSTLAGAYTIELRASDGVDWSEWASATVTFVTDNAGNFSYEAAQITVGGTPQTLHDFVGQPDHADFYRFTLGAAAAFDIDIDMASAGTFEFTLWGNGGASSVIPTTEFTGGYANNVALAAGDYLFKLAPKLSGSTTPSSFYDLTLSTS